MKEIVHMNVLKNMVILRIVSQMVVLLIGALIAFNSFPIWAFASSSSDVEVAGWIPYWRDSQGIIDAKKNIRDIDIIYPFSYVAKEDGTLKDLADMESSEWVKFIKYAHSKHVDVVPTVMWSDGGSIHANLSYPELRKKHIDNIIDMVKEGDYDGVNIDYESKFSTTIDHFSAFLTELKEELGDDKILACTIEARTPPDSLYKTVPSPLLYANDFKVIAEVCDTVEIMAYDQQRADLKLNDTKSGMPYMPVADVDWVEKVAQLALKDIPKEKIMLGIPTYGHHYEVTVGPNWFKNYRKIGALNLPDILDVAKEYKVTPGRNKAGEMSYTYFPKSSFFKVLSALPVPLGTQKGNEAAAQALLYANKTGQEVKFNMAWYSDAGAITQKVSLAEKYDLKGVAIFKFDGEEDRSMWRLF